MNGKELQNLLNGTASEEEFQLFDQTASDEEVIKGDSPHNSALLSPPQGDLLRANRIVEKREQVPWIAGVAIACAFVCILACVIIAFLLMIGFALTGHPSRYNDQPAELPKDFWVTIPAGEFQMGSENGDDDEKPVHTVYVDKFEIGKYEVTNSQYLQCVNAGICTGSAFGQDDNWHPVTSVSWDDANDYCAWAGGRLPTEAEWEKAARGTDQRTYSWGEDISCDKANYGGCGVSGTTPVGSYESGKGPYGVYDMVGNVWEWTSSLDQSYPYDENDGREDLNSSDFRVVRGGSFEDLAYYVRSAGRYGVNSGAATSDFGFRCARDSVNAPAPIIFK